MFDISWSEFLILAVVALLVVGPKDLPVLMRTLGRYAGMARRQATEFRAQFDEAMREAEMANLRDEMESVRRDVLSSTREAKSAIADMHADVHLDEARTIGGGEKRPQHTAATASGGDDAKPQASDPASSPAPKPASTSASSGEA